MTAKLYSSHRMAYKGWCFLVFLKSFLVISVSIYDKDLSITHIQEVGIKKLNVAEELQGETLPLKMGGRLYKIHGLKESAWYEVKMSYPASTPATFSIALKKKSSGLQVSANRRLLNTEKIVFKFDSRIWNSSEKEAFVLVTVEPAGIVAKPNSQEQKVVYFNIICEELFAGIPHRAWWVGIAALLCLLFAAVIPYYFPAQLLLRIHGMQSGRTHEL